MRVAVGSMWRDMGPVARRQLAQYRALHDLLAARGDQMVCLFVENDSIDDTWKQLLDFDAPMVLEQRSDDCPFWPSRDHAARWRHLAWVANGTLDMLAQDPADVFLYVESDLQWKPETMVELIDWTREVSAAAAANMQGPFWYDTWGSRNRGQVFQKSPPHHPDFTGEPMRVDSTCGAMAVRADVARRTRFQPEDCYVGWCHDITRVSGEKILLDPTLVVEHP